MKRFKSGNNTTTIFGKINGAIHTGSGNIFVDGEKQRTFTKSQLAKIYKSSKHKKQFEQYFSRLTSREKKTFSVDMKARGRASMPWRD